MSEDSLGALLTAIILGVVEGVTEFLPISSTGHLIVAGRLLGFSDPAGTFTIVIQLGAVLAVLFFYRRDLVERARSFSFERRSRRFWLHLAVASLPAGALGLAFEEVITRVLFNPLVVAVSLILGGVALWLVELRRGPVASPAGEDNGWMVEGILSDTDYVVAVSHQGIDAMTTRQALLIGLAQTLALVPGVSRSGASIVGGLLTGLDRPTATAFSFYLALPTLGAATVYKFVRELGSIAREGDLLLLAVGTVVAFLTALSAVGWLLRYVSHNDYKGLALYRVAAGLAVLALVYAGVIR